MNNIYPYLSTKKEMAKGIGKSALGWAGKNITNKLDQLAMTHRVRRDLNKALRQSGNGTVSSDILDNTGYFDGYTLSGYKIPKKINRDMISTISKDIGKKHLNQLKYGVQDPSIWDKLRSTSDKIYGTVGKVKDSIHQADLYHRYRMGDKRAGLKLLTRNVSNFINPHIQSWKDKRNMDNEYNYRLKQLDLNKKERKANLKWNSDLGEYETRS